MPLKAIHLLTIRIKKSNLGKRLVRGVFWSMVGSVISRGLMLCATILVARILGKEGYGQLAMIQSTVGMIGVFAGFGLGLTATKYVAEFRISDPDRAGRILCLSGVVAVITSGVMAISLVIFAPWLAEHTINAPHLAAPLRIGAIILFLSTLNGAQTGALAGFESFKSIALVNLATGLTSFPIIVIGAYFGGITGAVWALAVNHALNWMLNHATLRRQAALHRVPLTFRGIKNEYHILWKFSLPAALSGILVSPTNWVCSTLLANQPNGYGELAIYNAANQWSAAILFIPGMIGQAVLPILSNLNNTPNNKEKHKTILKINFAITATISSISVLPLIIFSQTIMRAYGAGFEQGSDALTIMSISAILISINSIAGSAIASNGAMWAGFVINSIWACILLSSAILLTKADLGALGIAYSTLIAYIAHTCIQLIYIKSIMQSRHLI